MPDQSYDRPHAAQFNVKIGNIADCLRGISSAIAKRAYEIYQMRGHLAGRDREDWQLAEKEILRPLCACGILESKDKAIVSITRSALDGADKDIEEVEVCAEALRLILNVTKKPTDKLPAAVVYRVLPLAHESDPSSLKLRLKQNGRVLEIEIRKASAKAHPRQQAA